MMNLLTKMRGLMKKQQPLPNNASKRLSYKKSMYDTRRNETGVTLTKASVHKLINELEKRGGAALNDLNNLCFLEYLDLSYNPNLSEISALCKLTSLKRLNLSYTAVSDISPLSSLKQLEILNLEGIPATDFSPLSTLKNLKILDLSETDVVNLIPLSKLTSIEELHFDDAHKLSDISPLFKLTSLKKLSLGWTDVPIEEAKRLKATFPNMKIYYQAYRENWQEIKA